MSVDLASLVQALRDDPGQRAALRELLGAGDADVQGALAALARAQERTEQALDQLTARLDELTKDVRLLAAAQARNEEALMGLLDVASGMQDRQGKIDSFDLELRYRERGPPYLQRVARRLRLIDSSALGDLVADAEDDGRLSRLEGESLMVADAVFSGQRRGDDLPVHLVVEASVTVARHDVRRARERADLLARLVGTPVLAVAAGDHVPEPVAVAAQDAEVWVVTRGRILAPDDDLDAVD